MTTIESRTGVATTGATRRRRLSAARLYLVSPAVLRAGRLADLLTHPRYGVTKVYRARVNPAPVPEGALKKLRGGVELEDGRTSPAGARQLRPGLLELELQEGRNRQVRRMCEAVGHRVEALERVAFGTLRVDGLPVGESRRLDAAEVERLRDAAGWKNRGQ